MIMFLGGQAKIRKELIIGQDSLEEYSAILFTTSKQGRAILREIMGDKLFTSGQGTENGSSSTAIGITQNLQPWQQRND
uniref:Uncharacterized protein n=1 Tax=Lepeophtheirus salmonis TaxID=72036 RepID=A0A0K2T7Y4_LEPSM